MVSVCRRLGMVHCRTEQERCSPRAELEASVALEEARLRRCIPPNPRSSTCEDVEERKWHVSERQFYFLGSRGVDRGWSEAARNRHTILQLHSRCQSLLAQGHPIDVRDLNIPQLTVRSYDDIARISIRSYGDVQSTDDQSNAALEIMLRYVNLTVLRWRNAEVSSAFKREVWSRQLPREAGSDFPDPSSSTGASEVIGAFA